MNRCREPRGRVGAVVPLTALLLVVLVGMLAFAIDLTYASTVESELQNVADAAALAGAGKLQDLFVQYNSPGQTGQSSIVSTATGTGAGTPRKAAQDAAALNHAGGVAITVPDSDVTFGYMDAAGNYSTSYSGLPNTVSVTTRRDDNANGSVALFFGKVFGVFSKGLTPTSRATIYAGDITSLQAIAGIDSHILPVALDVKTWTNFYATGKSPDGNTYYGSNGLPQLHVYPDPGNAPGQFGLLDVGPPQNNVPAFRNWIDDGQTPNDILYLQSNNLLPVSPSAPQEWKGGPGLKSTLVSNFQSVMGRPSLIPIFVAVQYPTPGNDYIYIAASGQGQGSYYSIIGFVGVTVSQATGNGSSMDISIQPMAVVDPTTVINSPTPAGTTLSNVGTSPTTFVSAKLTY
jgi:Flp pilus assembly protein TadG